jgi:hypothetical protein
MLRVEPDPVVAHADDPLATAGSAAISMTGASDPDVVRSVHTARLFGHDSGTRHLLPSQRDNPRPNLLHLYFHALFVVNFCLALMVRFQTI